MTTVILDTGLLAEATLSEGASWIARQQFSSEAPVAFCEPLETAAKALACFKLLDRFSQLAPQDKAHIDALAALRAGFVEHSLSSVNHIEWETVLANVLYLLQRGNDYVGGDAHVGEVTKDVARADGALNGQIVSNVFADTSNTVDGQVENLFKGFERAA